MSRRMKKWKQNRMVESSNRVNAESTIALMQHLLTRTLAPQQRASMSSVATASTWPDCVIAAHCASASHGASTTGTAQTCTVRGRSLQEYIHPCACIDSAQIKPSRSSHLVPARAPSNGTAQTCEVRGLIRKLSVKIEDVTRNSCGRIKS